jgi:ribosomal protein S18 acetylase RimI-like enzyme
MTLKLRPVGANDLAEVMRIQAECYPVSMQEPEDVVRSRIATAGHTSLLAHTDDGAACAYVFAYPGTLGKVTTLNDPFALPAAPDTLYIHDLAVPPSAAGRGLARQLVARLLTLAYEHRLAHAALVSVQGSQGFWERLGFSAAPAHGTGARVALASYPGGACYMARRLGSS